jgi:hypothetical protein
MMKSLYYRILFLLIVNLTYSSILIGGNKLCQPCAQKEQELILLFDSLKKTTTDSSKFIINQCIEDQLKNLLAVKSAFNYSFDSLKLIGRVYSPDRSFRIFSWNVAYSDITYHYFGIIQMNPGKDSICNNYVLNDKSNSYKGQLEDARFAASSWYGALYYDIIQQKIGKQTIYVILGLHLNDLFTNRKIIESLYFADNGRPMFGTPVFQFKNKTLNRIVFDYSIYSKMGLIYDSNKKMIVFDHLSPSAPIHTGNFMYYGPDFSYDGLRFENNKWIFYSNIDARNVKETKPKKSLPQPPK